MDDVATAGLVYVERVDPASELLYEVPNVTEPFE